MICTIDAKPGDLIFCEEAFAICPETSFVMNKQLCFMCCKDLRTPTNDKKTKKSKNSTSKKEQPSASPIHCPSCNLAFCSPGCATHPLHVLECGLIPKVCGAVIEADKQNAKLDLSTMLLIIRILLKGKVDKGYKQIEGMTAHMLDHSEAWRKKYEVFADIFCSDLPSEEDGSKFFNKAQIVEMACLLDTNAFGGRNHTTSQQLSTGLFYFAALLNHSCDPNVIYSVVDDKITMRAIKPIPKGTPLYDTYVDLLFPTRDRQTILLKSKSFFCTCPRCSDPTEQGRYLTAWKCNDKGCDGYVLPTVELVKDTKEIVQKWSCQKCKREVADTTQVPAQVQKFRELLAKRTWHADAEKFVQLATQLIAPSLTQLHANHHLRLFYSLEMCNALRSIKKFEEAIPHMQQVCAIVSKIAPNTIQEVDCQYQLGQIYVQAHFANSNDPSKYYKESKQAFVDAVRLSQICLGPNHPHTRQLNKHVST
eukprot:Phypoly_transcript_05985.p1 GENE.Phypoly_transcript_05985~~Phypoly_transcript_05985.p1  ORF type:complete len:479 (+),score=68.54 Phypoly_transcript_05985:429-1865(+)